MKTATLTLIVISFAVISAFDVKLSGLNYSPRKGADWAGPNKCKTPAEINSDLAIMKTVTDDIRLYSMRECNQMPTVLTTAKALGLKVWAGMWVDGNEDNFQEEKAVFAKLLQREDLDWNVVSGLHVGSEAVYRKEVTADQAILYFKEVKKMMADSKYTFPVTIADIADTYIAYPQLVDAVQG
jgi:glucan 1,3-beta-glucosidase